MSKASHPSPPQTHQPAVVAHHQGALELRHVAQRRRQLRALQRVGLHVAHLQTAAAAAATIVLRECAATRHRLG
jgi:uncharacterized protein (DUF305 family)